MKDVYIAMSIITAIANDGNLKTQIEGEYNLPLGEICEQHLADYLTANGLLAYRAKQRFVNAKVLKSRRLGYRWAIDELEYSELSCQLRCDGNAHILRQMFKPNFRPHPTYKVFAGDPAMDKSLLRPHQRDVLVKLDPVRRLSVEVKALTPSAFDRAYIQVGDIRKYDDKQFRVDALVLINQATGEAFVFTGDTSEMYRQKDADGAGGFSYAIEKAKLTPLDIWIDATKDIYGL